MAGGVVGVVALPLGIAFAIASGVRPEQGLYTAIIGGFLISALGGSRVQIGGPTGAFIIVVAEIIAEFGYQGLAVATAMAGCLLVLMAVARVGDIIRFIPYPVTVGFTTGIAVIIAVGEVGDALGLEVEKIPTHFLEKCQVYAAHLHTTNPTAIFLFLVTIAFIQLWPRVTRRIPGMMVALLSTTAIAYGLGLDVDTIGTRYGAIPTTLPSFRMLEFDWTIAPDLVSPAITIALLGSIESLLSALVADGMTGGRHRSNFY